MGYNYEMMERIPVDPKVVRRITRSAQMVAENPSMLSKWGGPGRYQVFASLPYIDRLTYAAILDGNLTPAEISTVTDLPESSIASAITRLEGGGLVNVSAETL